MIKMKKEAKIIDALFHELLAQERHCFPKRGKLMNAPISQGVYVIYEGCDVAHIGRTLTGKNGLRQRLNNHLYGSSSFSKKYLSGKSLRSGFEFQYLNVPNDRNRALLEALAIARLCPIHLGLGRKIE